MHWHIAYVFGNACTLSHKLPITVNFFISNASARHTDIESNILVQADWQNTFIYYLICSKCQLRALTYCLRFQEGLYFVTQGCLLPSLSLKILTVECHVMCAPLWTSARIKAMHLSFLVMASETRLKWLKTLEYETGAILLTVIFNSILSSTSTRLRFYLTDVKILSSPFNTSIHAAHRSAPPPFSCLFSYFLSFFPLPVFYKLRLPCFVFIWSVHFSFRSLIFSYNFLSLSFFLYCLLEFSPLFSLRVKFNSFLSVNFLWVSWFTPLFTEASRLRTYPGRAEFS